MEKEMYAKIATDALSNVVTKITTHAIVEAMVSMRLKDVSDVNVNLMKECNRTIYERVRMIKGDAPAEQLLKALNTACKT